MSRQRLPLGAVSLLLLLTLIWGGNMASIKVGARGLAPLFMAGIRSAVAALLLFGWMRLRSVAVFPDRQTLRHGLAVGLLFGAEFGCIYLGLRFTYASRAYVFLYIHPFVVALGAHLFLAADRLTGRKIAGLILAFVGVVILFAKDWGAVTLRTLPGDLLLLLAGVMWGATTLYIKRFLAGRAAPVQTLFYQLAFSAPLLFLMSFAMEDRLWYGWSWQIGTALVYQCVIVAFLSYIAWFELIDRYPVSLLTAFTFFTPIFGVFLSGALILGEALTTGVYVALLLVSGGMVLVNRPARSAMLPASLPPEPEPGD